MSLLFRCAMALIRSPFFSYTYTFNGDGMVYMAPGLQNNYMGA